MSPRSLPQMSDRDDVQKDDENDPIKARTRPILSRSRHVKYQLRGKSEDTSISGSKPKKKWLPWQSIWRNPEAPVGEEWIQGGCICTIGATVILCLNVLLFIVAASTGMQLFDFSHMGHGTGLHAFINVVSTGLLAASNFVMQCLSAPSREDITKAHARRKWLDIGTYSVRNFAWMDNKRKLLWVVLMVTSLPIHLLYNSVVYNSIASHAYGTIILPEDLTRNDTLASDNLTREVIQNHLGYSVADLQTQLFDGTFQDLDVQHCIKRYAVELNTDKSTLVMIADRKYFHNTSILRTSSERSPWPDNVAFSGYTYLCDDYYDCSKEELQKRAANHSWVVAAQHWIYPDWTFQSREPYPYDRFQCDPILPWSPSNDPEMDDFKRRLCSYIVEYNPDADQVRRYLTTESNWNSTLYSKAANISVESYSPRVEAASVGFQPNIPITGCRSKTIDETCELNFSWPIRLVVVNCNTIKVVCMYLATRKKRKNILLTVGDAISTFLADPDATTTGRCMMTRASIGHSWIHDRDHDPSTPLQQLQDKGGTSTPSDKPHDGHMFYAYPEMLPQRRRWWSAAGWKRWTIVIFLFMLCLAVTILLIVISIGGQQSSWTKGFGEPSGDTMLYLLTTDVVALVLLTNAPQIVLSILYLVYNSSLTCMVVGAEYTSYALERKPLRVSWPRGEQRSTYYLTLPYRYSIPFMVVGATLHWLLSQSFFLVQVQEYNVSGELARSSKGGGYSSIPMLLTAVIGFLATMFLLCLGIRPYKSQMPLAGHCSAAISAACHPPSDDIDAALKPVMWGEVSPASSSSSSRLPSLSPSSSLVMARNSPEILESGPEYGHCAFTSQEVSTPREIRLYA